MRASANILFSHYQSSKPVVLRATLEPGDDSRGSRLAAMPENVDGRALNCCGADATFGSGLIAVRRNRRRRRER